MIEMWSKKQNALLCRKEDAAYRDAMAGHDQAKRSMELAEGKVHLSSFHEQCFENWKWLILH